MAGSPSVVHSPSDGQQRLMPAEEGAVAGHHVRVLWTLILLVPLCGLVGIAGLANRGARAQSADSILECALLQGQPAVDACDEAMRSRLPVEIRAEAAHKKGVELGELTRYGDAVKAYRAAIRLKPDYAAAYTNLGFSLSRLERWQEACFAYENAIRLTPNDARSEEHTSELQSHSDLVCRLLLEKKKKRRMRKNK